MSKKYLSAAALCAVLLTITGCPPPGGWPLPPFGTTGVYEGTWQGRTTDQDPAKQVDILACPLTIDLTQDTTLPYPQDHGVAGTVTIDYSCLESVLPLWVEETPPPTEVNVTGLLADDGKLALVSGGCGPGVCLILTLGGEGLDSDEDGAMDHYAGAWSFIILLAGVEPFGVSGTFEVDSVDVAP
jgi:hypothetical protein